MKSFYKVIASIMLCGALMALPAGAQGRGNRNGGRPSTSASRPSSSASHSSSNSSSNNFGSRPSNSSNDGRRPSVNNRPAQSQGSISRPSNPGNRPSATTPSRPNSSFTDGGVTTRPGSGSVNNNNGFTRPGGNNGSANRPDNRHPEYGHGGTRPGNSFGQTRPGGDQANRPGGNPVNRPQPGVRPRPNTPPPAHRPMPVRPWSRPVPPPNWVPGPRVPTFTTLLGLSFGYGFNASINFLLNNNYTVYAYGNNAVYLNNVNMLNLMWPDATLYFSSGGLQYGDFIYATDYYATMRYNIAYSNIVSAYGSPVSTSYPNNGMSTCWYGRNGRFVTLTYAPMRGADGVFRYYTTLSFGM